jgi:hypothetical protein
MSAPTPPLDSRHRAGFAALILMLRELAHGLFADGRMLEGRALVDGIEALRAKTTGNLSEEEGRFLDDVLYDLHLAALKAPAPSPAAGDPPAGEAPGGSA